MSDVVSDLEAAAESLRDVESTIDRIGEDRVSRLADTYETFTDLLSRYRSEASGSGQEAFKAYVEFEGRLAAFVEDLPEDLPRRDAFERAADVLDRRRLDERDFDRAHEEVADVADIASLPADRTAALETYREARKAVVSRVRALDTQIEDLERTRRFADVDFDASTEALREPVEAYNDAVGSAFSTFTDTAPTRSVIDFIECTESYPLVPFRRPPDRLRSYVREHEVGTVPLPTLLEYADYSPSKLGHYVDDPQEFRAHVTTNRAYLERLDPEPLRIEWPPPPAGRLRYRIRELIPVADRFAGEDVIDRLRGVRRVTRDDDYERLRRTALAIDELSPSERERLESGEIDRELDARRDERERLRSVLDEYPQR